MTVSPALVALAVCCGTASLITLRMMDYVFNLMQVVIQICGSLDNGVTLSPSFVSASCFCWTLE